MQLPHTEHAIAEISGLQRSYMGGHEGRELRVADAGLIVGEEAFDSSVHEVSDIDLLSLSTFMDGDHRVPIRLPDQSLPVNVVVHSDPLERTDPEEVLLGRKILTRELQRSLEDVLPHDDRIAFYVAGYEDPRLLERRAQYLRGTETPSAAAHSIGRLATDGLTVVISTFKNLPLEQAQRRFRSTAGVKVNHPWDLRLQPDTGKHDTGDPDMPVVNTDRGRMSKKLPQELVDYWAIQEQRHYETIARLERAGLKMAYAIFDKQRRPDFADSTVVDRQLARAIQAAGHN